MECFDFARPMLPSRPHPSIYPLDLAVMQADRGYPSAVWWNANDAAVLGGIADAAGLAIFAEYAVILNAAHRAHGHWDWLDCWKLRTAAAETRARILTAILGITDPPPHFDYHDDFMLAMALREGNKDRSLFPWMTDLYTPLPSEDWYERGRAMSNQPEQRLVRVSGPAAIRPIVDAALNRPGPEWANDPWAKSRNAPPSVAMAQRPAERRDIGSQLALF
jgi:hypothetical protein